MKLTRHTEILPINQWRWPHDFDLIEIGFEFNDAYRECCVVIFGLGFLVTRWAKPMAKLGTEGHP